MKKLCAGIGCVLALLLVGGCDTQGKQDDFANEAGLPPSGITEVDADGHIVAEDPDDWRTSPLYAFKIFVDPASPNPTAGALVTITLNVREFNAVRGGLLLRARDANGRFLAPLDEIDDASDPGFYAFRFSPVLLGRIGLHRLFIFDFTGELVSYGDLRVD